MPNVSDLYHMRISLASVCNLRCIYCNPNADHQSGGGLSNAEICDVLTAGAELGIERVHYSGGEPTIRRGFSEIISHASGAGYSEQVITTNGVLLGRHIEEYIQAGLSRVTISIDSFDRSTFAGLTGRDALADVRVGIDKAIDLLGVAKLNMVVLTDNLHEIPNFIEFSHLHGGRAICRFIELQSNQPAFFRAEEISKHHVPLKSILETISTIGSLTPAKVSGENPNCSYYKIAGCDAILGVIANHSRGYPCGGCRKVRVSPYGDIGVCISTDGVNVRSTTLREKVSALRLQLNRREVLDHLYPHRKHHSNVYGFWRWGDVSIGSRNEQPGDQSESI